MNTYTDDNGIKYLNHPYLTHLWLKEDGTELWTARAFNGVGEPRIDMEKPYRPMHPRADKNGYLIIATCIDGKTKRFRYARLAWETYNQKQIPDKFCIDHINHNILDHSQSNLRLASHDENIRNRITSNRARINNVGKGIYLYTGKRASKNGRNYQAQLIINGKAIHLGRFYTAEAAQQAYDQACLKYHGSFALTNQQIKQMGLI